MGLAMSLLGRLRTFAVASTAAVLSTPALPADISVGSLRQLGGYPVLTIHLTGQIAPGDAQTVRRIVDQHRTVPSSFAGPQTIIHLSSPGGSFSEGIQLARLFREKAIQTHVPSDSVCASACAIAFLGGAIVGEEENTFVSRSIAPKAKLGFHAPYLEIQRGQYGRETVEAAYFVAVRSIGELISLADDLSISPALLPRFLTRGPDELEVIRTADDLGRFRVQLEPQQAPPYLTRSMIANACRNGANWREGGGLKPQQTLTDAEIAQLPQGIVTHRQASNYFGRGSYQTARTAVPALWGPEGTVYWCFIDHAIVENKLRWACRGYINAIDRNDAIKRAAETFDRNNDGDLRCDRNLIVGPISGYNASLEMNNYWLVTGQTAVDAIPRELQRLISTEPRVTPQR